MSYAYSERHDSLGFCLWRDSIQAALPDQFPFPDLCAKEINTCLKYCESWLEIVTGHHGVPPKRKLKERFSNFFQLADEQATLSFFLDAFRLLLKYFEFRS